MNEPESASFAERTVSALRALLQVHEARDPSLSGWSAEERVHRRLEKKYWVSSLILSVFVILGAGGSAVFAEWTYSETKRQADLAQANLLATTRAWVNILDDQVLIDAQWQKASPFKPADSLRVTVDVGAKNGGLSPALGATLDMKFWNVTPGPQSSSDEHDAPQRVCAADTHTAPAEYGILFMSSTYNRPTVTDVVLRDIAAVEERMPFAHANPYRFLVCAHYRVIGENVTHLTVKAFELLNRRLGEAGVEKLTTPAFGDDVSHLVVRRLPFGEYAN